MIEHFRPIADAIGVPHNKVRIRGALVGGGFGGKEDLTVEVYLALLAKRTGRPVRLEYTREDSFVGHGKRHPFILTYRTGVTKDGKITALDVRMVADSGAYVFLSPYVLLYALVAAPGPYRVDNLNVFARAVATNNMFTSAFRGFGALQACAAYEQQMDEVAKALGLDRLELPPAQLPEDRRADVHGLRAAERDLDRPVRRTGLGRARRAHALRRSDPDRPRHRLLPAELRPAHLPARHLRGLGRGGDGRHRGGAFRGHRHRRRPGLGARPDRGGGPRRHPRQRRDLQQRFRGDAARRHHHRDPRPVHDRQRGEAGGGRSPGAARRTRRQGVRRRAGRSRHGRQRGSSWWTPPKSRCPLVDLVRICGAEGIHRSELSRCSALPSPTFSTRRPVRARPIPTTPTARTRSRWRWTWTPGRWRC